VCFGGGKCLACAYAPDNIQVNAILPGFFNTPLTRQGKIDIEGLEESVNARTPMGRWGEPEELAGTAIYLASKASDFMTGASIVVDGGWSVMM
jgi:2-deoxy-D-gluconate 3-dehydrogenase